jgi:integration host factor subunit alpha
MTKSDTMSATRVVGSPRAERTVGHDLRPPPTRTITRVDLAEAVYRHVGLSRKESATLVQLVLSELADALTAGETVKLSSFGSFVVRSKAERIGRNPKTGVEAPITQRRVIVFKPSSVLKAYINGQVSVGEED